MRIALPPVIDAAAFADPPRGTVVDLGGGTMGTRWSVRLVPPPGCDLASVHAAIVERLDGLVAQMSHWLPDSLLCRFNGAAAGTTFPLSPDFAAVMAAGLDVAAITGGAFDPAIGALVDLHGFGPTVPTRDPTPDAVAAAWRQGGWQRLTLEGDMLTQPGGVALDLSGIAKGYAVDALARLLERHGVRDTLVEIGGELAGRGIRPDREPWWVDLEAPPGRSLPPFRLALHGLAVATSGDYRRGRHTIDPRTGRQTENGVTSVSVVHESAMHADAWATALTVLGAAGLPLAAAHGIAARIVDGADEHLTPALAAMLDDG